MDSKGWTDEGTKMAIIADKAAGVPVRVICSRYGLNASTVWRICKKVQLAHPRSALSRGSTSEDLKTRITSKAYNALEGGLDCADDPYRRGALGHQTLKEIGTLAELGAQNEGEREAIRQLAGMSEEMRKRYLNPEPEPEPRILSAEDHETWALDVFQKSGMTAFEFNRERSLARRGERRLLTNEEEVEEFFRAEEVRASMGPRD
jgi:hypothetical protein